jgi:hypothetical protein
MTTSADTSIDLDRTIADLERRRRELADEQSAIDDALGSLYRLRPPAKRTATPRTKRPAAAATVVPHRVTGQVATGPVVDVDQVLVGVLQASRQPMTVREALAKADNQAAAVTHDRARKAVARLVQAGRLKEFGTAKDGTPKRYVIASRTAASTPRTRSSRAAIGRGSSHSAAGDLAPASQVRPSTKASKSRRIASKKPRPMPTSPGHLDRIDNHPKDPLR